MYHTTRTYPSQDTVSLQGVGHCIGTPSSELKPGDVTMWNYGSKSTVLEIVKETKAFRTVKFQSECGYVGDRKLKKSRLVVILSPTKEEIN